MYKFLKLLSVGVVITLVAVVAVGLTKDSAKAEGPHTVTFDPQPSEGLDSIDITSGGTLVELAVVVEEGSDLKFKVTPNKGYRVENATTSRSNGEEEVLSPNDGVYTLSNVAEDITVTLNFVETHEVTFDFDDVQGILTIDEDSKSSNHEEIVDKGDSLTFTVEAKEGYRFDKAVLDEGPESMTADGEPTEGVYTFTIAEVDDDHTVTLYFIKTWEVTFSEEGDTGIITNAETEEAITSPLTVNDGTTLTFTVVPNDSSTHKVLSVVDGRGSGTTLDPDGEGVYTLSNVTGDVTVTITFKQYWTITFAVEPENTGGAYNEAGDTLLEEVEVFDDENLTFTVEPTDPSTHEIESVVVDSSPTLVDAEGVYEIKEIKTNHIVTLNFKRTHYKVTFKVDPEGAGVAYDTQGELIEGYALVEYEGEGKELEFTVAPDSKYKIESVEIVDENGNGTMTLKYGIYKITEISDDITVEMKFIKKTISYGGGGGGGSSSGASDKGSKAPDEETPEPEKGKKPAKETLLEKPISEMTQAEIRAKLIEIMELLLSKLEQLLVLMQQQN